MITANDHGVEETNTSRPGLDWLGRLLSSSYGVLESHHWGTSSGRGWRIASCLFCVGGEPKNVRMEEYGPL